MADKLNAGTPVTKAPTRAAKGAGKSAPRKVQTTLKAKKPDAPKVKSQPDEKAIRENLQNILMKLTAKHRALDNQLDALKASAKPLQDERLEVRTAIRNAGFPLATFDEKYKAARAKTSRVDLNHIERMRDIISEAFGLPSAPQPELFDERTPPPLRAAMHWEATGYTAGVMADDYSEFIKGVPPEHKKDADKGYSMGQERNARAIKAPAAADAPKAEGSDASAGVKAHSGEKPAIPPTGDPKLDAWAAQPSAAEAKAAAASGGDGDRAEGTEEKKPPGAQESDKRTVSPPADEEFEEASAAELEGQTTRRVIAEAKAADLGEPASELMN